MIIEVIGLTTHPTQFARVYHEAHGSAENSPPNLQRKEWHQTAFGHVQTSTTIANLVPIGGVVWSGGVQVVKGIGNERRISLVRIDGGL